MVQTVLYWDCKLNVAKLDEKFQEIDGMLANEMWSVLSEKRPSPYSQASLHRDLMNFNGGQGWTGLYQPVVSGLGRPHVKQVWSHYHERRQAEQLCLVWILRPIPSSTLNRDAFLYTDTYFNFKSSCVSLYREPRFFVHLLPRKRMW